MKTIRDYFNNAAIRKRENKRKAVEERAEELYDVSLHNSRMWLCYDGNLVAPFDVFSDAKSISDCATIVDVMRKLYIERTL